MSTVTIKSIKAWDKNIVCVGKSPVTEAEAITWAQSKGADTLYYLPTTQTAFIAAPGQNDTLHKVTP